jgi:hypothetical protein
MRAEAPRVESAAATAQRADELDALLADVHAAATLRCEVASGRDRVLFAASSSAAAEWPRRYLQPTFAFARPAAIRASAVHVVCCSALHDRARRLLDRVGRGRAAETYEGNTARRHGLGRGRLALAYVRRPGVTFVEQPSRVVSFVTAGEDDEAPFEAARLIRALLTGALEERGLFVVHAGAVRVGGRGVLICGPKRAGKTTLVCALAETAGAEFIANDRVYVGAVEERLRLQGWPMSVRIGIGTCLASPGLRAQLRPGSTFAYPQTGWEPAAGISEVDARRLARTPDAPKVELIPSELARALDTAVVGSADLGCVVLPRYGAHAPPAELVPVAPGEAAARLRAQLLTPDDDAYPDWLSLRRTSRAQLAAQGERLLRRLVREAPLAEVRFSDALAAADAVAGACTYQGTAPIALDDRPCNPPTREEPHA